MQFWDARKRLLPGAAFLIDRFMSAAVFFLAVNFLIAICFSAVFAVVSVYSRSRLAAQFFSAGFAIASLTAICELGVAYSTMPVPWAIGVYSTVLAGLVFLQMGIAALYGRPVPIPVAVITFLVGMTAYLVIIDVPPGSLLHGLAYQGPYALVMLAASASVFMSSRRLAIDRALAFLLLFTGLHFFVKAWLAVTIGAGNTARDYVSTNYAVISQSLTAVAIVAVGLMLLAVLALEIMAEERDHAERDSLSGLSNRRGFEKGVRLAMLGNGNRRHALILCDLDHFKSINDTHGHHGGDMVIRSFGGMLRSHAGAGAIVGRIGGEEFAVFLPNTPPTVAVVVAETLRTGVKTMVIPGMPADFIVTASFGVAGLSLQESLEEAMRKADAALYDAKRSGRDCVRQTAESPAEPSDGRNGLHVVK